MTFLYSWSANGFSNQGEKGNKTEPYRILLQNNMQKKFANFRSMKTLNSDKLKVLSHRQTFNMSF